MTERRASPPSPALPTYAEPGVRDVLLKAGASGTVYSLVMPESERALAHVLDGGDRAWLLQSFFQARESEAAAKRGNAADLVDDIGAALDDMRRASYFSRFHEPWTRKQDAVHDEYFDHWLDWASPVVSLDAEEFPMRYPTSGASEGIFKIMAEYAASCCQRGVEPTVHVFEGEYEGFAAYAQSLRVRLVRQRRDDWHELPGCVDPDSLFWISQPSAIDGRVWRDFDAFVTLMGEARPDVWIVPDLTYVGSVGCPFRIDLSGANIPACVFSHSKPFGGYYHRIGGVLSRRAFASLFGNKWFKNLQSLAWATEMMKRHGVFDLPRKYRSVQEAATRRVAEALGVDTLQPADVMLLATAPPDDSASPLLDEVIRGGGTDRVIRLCVTPLMTCLIDPAMAPSTCPKLALPDGASSTNRSETSGDPSP